jgi:hypothetical protein
MGDNRLPAGPYCCFSVDLDDTNAEVQRARRKLLNVQEFARRKGYVEVMTFELKQGVNTNFPNTLAEPYLYLKTCAPTHYNAGLFRRYVQDLVRFVDLRKYLVPKVEYRIEQLNGDLWRTKIAWARLAGLWSN